MNLPVRIRSLLEDRRTIWWIVGIALGVRLIMLLLLHDSFYTSGMAQGELARNLAEGRGFVINGSFADSLGQLQIAEDRLVDVGEAVARFSPTDEQAELRPFIAYMMPGQGILLAGSYLLTGTYSYLPLQVLQIIIDSLGVLLIVQIGTLLFSRHVGLLAAMGFAVYIPEARLAITATRDAWMPIIYLLTVYASVRLWKDPVVRNALLLGGIIGLGIYFRTEILLIPIFVGVAYILTGHTIRTMSKMVVVAFLPIILLLAPWTTRNYVVFDKFIPTNSGFWVAMWECLGEYPNDFGAVHSDIITQQQMRDAGHEEAFDTPEYDALFRPKVLGVLAEHPASVGWTIVRRLIRMPLQMHAWGIPATDDIHSSRPPYPTGSADAGSYLQRLLDDPGRLLIHVLLRGVNLTLFVAIGFWFWRNRRGDWRPGLVLVAVPLYNVLIHAITCAHARYIVPTNSLHLVFLAAIVVSMLQEERRTS